MPKVLTAVICMKRQALPIVAVALAVIAGSLVWVRAQDVADRQGRRQKPCRERMQKGETLTPDEKAYLQTASRRR